MKEQHGLSVPAHRPPENTARDAQIHTERAAHPTRSFERIGRKYGISRNAARQAFKRHADRQKKRLAELLNRLPCLQEEIESLPKSTPSNQ